MAIRPRCLELSGDVDVHLKGCRVVGAGDCREDDTRFLSQINKRIAGTCPVPRHMISSEYATKR